jgi:site-specific DNA-methyltransferase (cytosine-N4-specific)
MLWWLSKSEDPQADNRQVLKPYSRSMKRLLRDGYKVARRPSQHDIGPHFQRDNGGAIPPNLLTIPNTRSNDEYLHRCRAANAAIHPARFPPAVPEFFVRFLTKTRQTVLDPFAGSNVTGFVAETLGRSWISMEISKDYVESSRLRFPDAVATSAAVDSAAG